MNFQLSSSQHKWQQADQQQEIQNSMNELRKGIRSNVTEKVTGFNKFFDNSKLNTDISNSSYSNFNNQLQKDNLQSSQQHQYSPNKQRLFEKINYDSYGQQQQQQQIHQSQQQTYSPLKLSHKFYSPRAVPSFDNLQKNLKDQSAGKSQIQQSQPYFKNDKQTLTSSLWGDASHQQNQQKFSSQYDRSYQNQSTQQTGSPTRISQVQKSIETLGPKSQNYQQQQQNNGIKGIYDINARKMSVQTSPQSQTKSNLLSEIDFFKKREVNPVKQSQTPTSSLLNKLSSSFLEGKKDQLSESFSVRSGAYTTKNAQLSPARNFSSASLSNLNASTGFKRQSMYPTSTLVTQASVTPLRKSVERPNFSANLSSSSSLQQQKRRLVDKVPIQKITEIRSHIENITSSESSTLPASYVEELTRLAASITKTLKSTKFYEKGFY